MEREILWWQVELWGLLGRKREEATVVAAVAAAATVAASA